VSPRRELGVEEGGLAVAGVGEGLVVAALAVERPVVGEGEAVAGLEDPEEVVIRLVRIDRRRLAPVLELDAALALIVN
jgi:hypothetical protein